MNITLLIPVPLFFTSLSVVWFNRFGSHLLFFPALPLPVVGAVVVAAAPGMPRFVNVPGGERHHDMGAEKRESMDDTTNVMRAEEIESKDPSKLFNKSSKLKEQYRVY